MSVILSNDFILFQIPTLDHSVFAAGKQVWMSRRHRETTNRRDMPRERQSECSGCQVPDFDSTISCTRTKPFISGFHCQRSHPTEVATNNLSEFPWSMP